MENNVQAPEQGQGGSGPPGYPGGGSGQGLIPTLGKVQYPGPPLALFGFMPEGGGSPIKLSGPVASAPGNSLPSAGFAT